MTTSSPAPRTAGLDTLRALAISLVFVYHYAVFVSHRPTFGWASVVGWAGVDLFFVLSGYLIANQLFAGLARGSAVAVPAFYARRALRTLPVFWLVLAAYALAHGALGGRTPPPWWRFLSFTQNLGLQGGTAFSHAWSLCVEEQFYLVLPLVLAAGARLALGRRHGWTLLALLAALGVAARGVLWHRVDPAAGGDPAGFMPLIYYSTLTRFDEFLPGIAIALLKNFHPEAWSRAMAHGRLLLALGLAGALAVLARFYVEDALPVFGFFTITFGYSLLAWSFGLLVLAALSPATALHRVRVPGAGRIALWSYSIYLSHKPLAFVLQQALAPMRLPDAALAVTIALASLALGAVLFTLVEAPFLALRDRLFPSNFRAGPAAPAQGAGAWMSS
jgi:peptidoglycan/LPS O-acetylase OafA/YrhL